MMLRRWVIMGALLLSIATLGSACLTPSEPGPVVEESALPALVALSQSYHTQADIALDRGDLKAAEDSIKTLIREIHAAELDHHEAYEFGMDAYGRLARLQRQQGKLQDALETTERGLEFGAPTRSRSLFAGYLYQTQGDILRELGDDHGAVEAHREAILIFKRILEGHGGTR